MRPTVHRGLDTHEAGATPAGRQNEREVTRMKGTEAIDHIRDEMAASREPYVGVIGEMMTTLLQAHPDTEIHGDKTLKGAFDVLREHAKKNQKGGYYAYAPEEAFRKVMEYYGLAYGMNDFITADRNAKTQPTAAPARTEPEKPRDMFDLDALMED